VKNDIESINCSLEGLIGYASRSSHIIAGVVKGGKKQINADPSSIDIIKAHCLSLTVRHEV
jgi:hypothetical protein